MSPTDRFIEANKNFWLLKDQQAEVNRAVNLAQKELDEARTELRRLGLN